MMKKHTNENHKYTPEEVKELIKCAGDVVYFCNNYVHVRDPILCDILFEPRDYEIDTLNNYNDNLCNITLHTRQAGITTTIAAYALWYAIFNRDCNIVLSAPKMSGSRDIIYRIQYMFERLPVWLRPDMDKNSWNKSTCSFENKSRIIATYINSCAVKGMSISMLFIDDMAYAPLKAQDEFMDTILPHLYTDSRCNIASGANQHHAKGDTFTEMWEFALEHPEVRFVPQFIGWDDVPGRDKEFKLRTIRAIGEDKWKSEYECTFHG